MATSASQSNTPVIQGFGNDLFQIDAETLNHCLDEIEAFTNNLQGIYGQLQEYKRMQAKKGKVNKMKAMLMERIPPGNRFVDIFKKLKLSLNLTANLENNMTSTKAPDLCRLLINALALILDVCRMAHGDIAPRVISPLFTFAAKDLMERSLDAEHKRMIHSLGNAWIIIDQDWTHGPVSLFTPVFNDGFRPYRSMTTTDTNHSSAHTSPMSAARTSRISHSSDENRDRRSEISKTERLSEVLSTDQLNFEKSQLDKQENILALEKQKLEAEAQRLEIERQRLEEAQVAAVAVEKEREEQLRKAEVERSLAETAIIHQKNEEMEQKKEKVEAAGQSGNREIIYIVQPPHDYPKSPEQLLKEELPPRQRIFLAELLPRRAKIAQVMFTLPATNPLQLSVSKNEYLEVLNSDKQWWECRNASGKTGYVPCTILSPLDPVQAAEEQPPPEPTLPVLPPISDLEAPIYIRRSNLAEQVYNPPQQLNYSPRSPVSKREEQAPRSPISKRQEQVINSYSEERTSYSPPVAAKPKSRYIQERIRNVEGKQDVSDYDYQHNEPITSGDRYQWNHDIMIERGDVPTYIKERIGKRGFSYIPTTQ